MFTTIRDRIDHAVMRIASTASIAATSVGAAELRPRRSNNRPKRMPGEHFFAALGIARKQ